MERNYIQLLDKYLSFFPCVAIIGPRQCGKTYFARSALPDWRHLDLERDADKVQVESDPDLFLRLNTSNVVIDEAQELPGLFPALRVAIDSDRDKTGRFVITGSSSPALIGGISESLAGRVGIIEMSPFSMSEAFGLQPGPLYDLIRGLIPSIKEGDIPVGRPDDRQIHRYWLQGGYPEPWVRNDEGFREAWLENYFRTYIYRDVARLFPRLNAEKFRLFIRMIAGLSGKVINYADISRALDVSQPTVKDYFQVADGTFFWRQIRAFDKKSVRRMVRHPKGIIRDSGLHNHLLKTGSLDALLAHPQKGASWEGMVVEQVIRNLQTTGEPFDYSHYRTATGDEIDLILEGKFGLTAVEVTYSSSPDPRDVRVLRGFTEEFDAKLGLLISNDTRVRKLGEKILGVPAAMV
jgi:predicted AAA+ superfamily ATPase